MYEAVDRKLGQYMAELPPAIWSRSVQLRAPWSSPAISGPFGRRGVGAPVAFDYG